MSRSSEERAAKEFLVAEIAAQADREGMALSEIEPKMLFFSEDGWTPPEIAEVAEAFDRECDEQEYERQISGLIRRARKRSDKRNSQLWSGAIKRLRRGDHYLLALVDEAETRSGWSRREIAIAAIAIAAFVVFVVILEWYLGHVPKQNELAFFMWVAAWVLLGLYLALRFLIGESGIDRTIERVLHAIVGRGRR